MGSPVKAKPKKQEFDYEAWAKRFHKEIQKDSHSAKSCKALKESGLPIESVQPFFCFACDFPGSPSQEILTDVRRGMLLRAKVNARLAIRLREDHRTLLELKLRPTPSEVIANLPVVWQKLEKSSKKIRAEVSQRRLNPGLVVSWLVRAVGEITCRKHYREISFLLHSAYCAHGVEPPMITEDAIRKAYQRHLKSKEEDFEEIYAALGWEFFAALFIAAILA